MKKILICIAALGLLIGSCERAPEMNPQGDDLSFVKFGAGDVIPGQYIVVLNPDFLTVKTEQLSFADAQLAMAMETQKVLSLSGINSRTPLFVYSAALKGFAINLSDSEVAALDKSASVKEIYPDRMFILAKPGTNPSQPAQQTPPGITRVGGGTTYTGTAKAWIIDTGVDLDHPDLNVNTTLGRNFISTSKTPDDDNGHGTHCAGIVAAKANTIGVVGVAAGAQVVPVKVLDRRGSGA